MPSYNNEFPKTPERVFAEIQLWKSSTAYREMCDGRDYAVGNNVTIRETKKLYYSDPKKAYDTDGNEVLIGGGFVVNPYVSNFKIGYGILKDIISQKTNTLFDELPNIKTDYKIPQQFIKNLGYALKVAGNRASASKLAYIYQDYEGNLTVFKTENCIPYFDDRTGILRGLVRFWYVGINQTITANSATSLAETLWAEVYDSDGMTTYSTDAKSGLKVQTPKTPYKFKKYIDFYGEKIEGEKINFPIVMLKNNEEMHSDLTPNIRSKIDAIDIVNSGFANNIEDFSELYWVVKNASGMDQDKLLDFIANINRTKKVVVGDGDEVKSHKTDIPWEARTKFVEQMKAELVQDAGIIDTSSITGASLTTTAIKAATLKLRHRVSEFEWQAYNTANELIKLYQAYNSVSFEFDVEFSKMFISNDTELIDNAVKIRGDIDERSYLEILKRAGMISDVEEVIKRKAEESMSSFKIEEPPEDGEEADPQESDPIPYGENV